MAHPIQLDTRAWRSLLAESDAIEVYPAHSCNSDVSFEGLRIWRWAGRQEVDVFIANARVGSLRFDEATNDFTIARAVPIERPEALAAPIVELADLA